MNVSQALKSVEYDVINTFVKKFGLSGDQVREAISWLAPALTRGLEHNASAPAGLQSLLEALKTGDHQRYVEDPSYLDRPETREDGNEILGHIFGSKEVSRNVAERASLETGIGSSILKLMLPYVASAVMGILSKKLLPQSEHADSPSTQSSLFSWLDSDRDGSIIDDMLGHAFKRLIS